MFSLKAFKQRRWAKRYIKCLMKKGVSRELAWKTYHDCVVVVFTHKSPENSAHEDYTHWLGLD